MKITQYIKYYSENICLYEYSNISEKSLLGKLKDNSKAYSVKETWAIDQNGKELARFINGKKIKGDERLKKGTKEEVLKQVYESIWVRKSDIKSVLNSLEEKGYIEFKKELKTYKVFVKIVTIDGENKKLYYVTDSNLTDNIDEAKRFEIDEEKDGYAYELVKEY